MNLKNCDINILRHVFYYYYYYQNTQRYLQRSIKLFYYFPLFYKLENFRKMFILFF